MLTINKEIKFKEKQTCGKNNSDALGCTPCTTFFSLPHFEVIFDRQPNRSTEIWIVFVKQSLNNGLLLVLGQNMIWPVSPPKQF